MQKYVRWWAMITPWTEKGCQELITKQISLPQLCRDVKAAGLTIKRLKIRPGVVQTPANIENR